jgi:hypothetical protein
MRYGILEFFFLNNMPVFQWVARDMSLSSANDAKSAWNYQVGQKGGWMEVIPDTDEAFELKKSEILQFHPRIVAK